LASVPRFDAGGVLTSAVILLFTACGCDESLPPRLADPNAISVNVRLFSGRVTVQNGVAGGNASLVEASVTNIYTEVLQDTQAVNVRCRLWLADFPDSAGITTIGITSLTDPRFLQGNVLTLLPHSTALFDKYGDFTTLNGTPFWNMLTLKDTSDMQGPYKLSDPVQVAMSDTVRIFKAVPDYILSPRYYTIQFEIR